MKIEFSYSNIGYLCKGDVFYLPSCTIKEIPWDILSRLGKLDDSTDRLYLLFDQALQQYNKKIKSIEVMTLASVLLSETSVKLIISKGDYLQLHIEGTPTPIELFQRYITEKKAGNAQAAFTHLYQLAHQNRSKIHLTDLGVCYEEGLGTTTNLEEAVKCYMLAANKGCQKAQYQLGKCYRFGKGVNIDPEKAYTYFQIASVNGDENAEYEVGMCFYKGKGVEMDFGQAFTYFKRSADKRHKIAQYYVGLCYDSGNGVQTNLSKSISWMTLSANQGVGAAQLVLGDKYFSGVGCSINYQIAAAYYALAADQGISKAQFNLGECYYEGLGVEKDTDQAIHYFEKAADQGHSKAIKKLSGQRKKNEPSTNPLKYTSAPGYSANRASIPKLRISSDTSLVNTRSQRTIYFSSSSPKATEKSKLSISTIPSSQSQIPTTLSQPQIEIEPIHNKFETGTNKLRRHSTDPNYLKDLSATIRLKKSLDTLIDP